MKIVPTGRVHLRFKKDNSHYSWKKPETRIHNIVIGSLWVDHVSASFLYTVLCLATLNDNFNYALRAQNCGNYGHKQYQYIFTNTLSLICRFRLHTGVKFLSQAVLMVTMMGK